MIDSQHTAAEMCTSMWSRLADESHRALHLGHLQLLDALLILLQVDGPNLSLPQGDAGRGKEGNRPPKENPPLKPGQKVCLQPWALASAVDSSASPAALSFGRAEPCCMAEPTPPPRCRLSTASEVTCSEHHVQAAPSCHAGLTIPNIITNHNQQVHLDNAAGNSLSALPSNLAWVLGAQACPSKILPEVVSSQRDEPRNLATRCQPVSSCVGHTGSVVSLSSI